MECRIIKGWRNTEDRTAGLDWWRRPAREKDMWTQKEASFPKRNWFGENTQRCPQSSYGGGLDLWRLWGRKVQTLVPCCRGQDPPVRRSLSPHFSATWPESGAHPDLLLSSFWELKNWCFWTVVLEETLESPLDCKEIQPVHPKGDQSWIFVGRTDVEAETPILWPPDAKSWLIGKAPDAGKDWRWEEKGTTENEMVGWHHRLDGHEFEYTPGVGDGQGGLAAVVHAKSRTRLSDWIELNWAPVSTLARRERCGAGRAPGTDSSVQLLCLSFPVTCETHWEHEGPWARVSGVKWNKCPQTSVAWKRSANLRVTNPLELTFHI